MRVAIDVRMIRITGIGRYIQELVRAQLSHGLKPTLLVAPQDKRWVLEKFGNVDIKEVPEQIYSWSEQLLMPARLQKDEFDLVHFTNFNMPVSIKLPYVLTVHDLTPLSFAGERRTGWASQKAYRYVVTSGIKNAKEVMVPTEQVAAEVQRLVPAAKLNVVPYAIAPIFRTPQKSPKNSAKPYILYVGNFRNHKNIPTLLQAFEVFAETDPKVKLVLAGKITQQKKQSLKSIVSAKVAKRLDFAGEVSDPELVRLYDGASLFVLPSFKEGYGFGALEAASRKVPVLCSETIPVREFLDGAVMSFDPLDVRGLADLMTLMINDKKLRAKKITEGYELALGYSWDNVVKKVLDVYDIATSFHNINES